MIKKILGLLLLFIGLAIIFYGLYTSYNIFTAKSQPPEIFTIEEKDKIAPAGTQGFQDQMEKMLEEQLKGLLPTDSIPKTLNLVAWSIFAGILIFAGGQISSLGIKLIR